LAVAATIFGLYSTVSPALSESGTISENGSDRGKDHECLLSDTLQVTGVVIRGMRFLVRPDREGLQISQVLVEPGDTVVSGQVLAPPTAAEGQQWQ